MKILYIEDEITTNIPRIIALFSKQLGEEIVNKLKGLSEDEYAATAEEIKGLVDSSNCIEVEYKFSRALDKVMNQAQDYELFIVDRNLTKGEDYELASIQAIDSGFEQKHYDKYQEREGDYLLKKLLTQKVEQEKFFFMTAYSATETIRGEEELGNFMSIGSFTENNFIEKGKPEDTRRLQEIINDLPNLEIRRRYKEVFEVFEQKLLNKEIEAELLSCIKTMEQSDSVTIKNNLTCIRRILEAILFEINKVAPNIIPSKLLKSNKKELEVKKALDHLKDTKEELRSCIKKQSDSDTIKNSLASIRKILETTLLEINKVAPNIIEKKLLKKDKKGFSFKERLNHLEKNKIIDNVIKAFARSIWQTASSRGAHYENKGSHNKLVKVDYSATKYTVQSLTFALMDIILWMKSLLK